MAKRIWLDDEYEQRKSWFPAEEGWIHCRWPEEVIKHLETGIVEVVSLDHDLGEDVGYSNPRTGYDVVTWLEEKVFTNQWPHKLPHFLIHSINPEGKRRMAMGIRQIINKHIHGVEENKMKTIVEQIKNISGMILFLNEEKTKRLRGLEYSDENLKLINDVCGHVTAVYFYKVHHEDCPLVECREEVLKIIPNENS